MKKTDFTARVCTGQFEKGCGQTLEYLLPMDRGTAEIVVAIGAAVRRKGINAIHLTKEMEVPHDEWTFERAKTEGVLTSTQIGNASRAHRHGLIAAIKGKRGNWCLTTKGGHFLSHKRVARYAIVSKVTGHQDGYFEPEALTITIDEALGQNRRWEGIDYEIDEGMVLRVPQVKKTTPPTDKGQLL